MRYSLSQYMELKHSNYHINHQRLEKVTKIKERKLRFDKHIIFTFTKWQTRLNIKSKYRYYGYGIYSWIVRSNLKYCSSVWNPHHSTQIFQIERVQKSLIVISDPRWVRPNDDCTNILKSRQVFMLETRNVYFDLCFVHKIFNCKVVTKTNES